MGKTQSHVNRWEDPVTQSCQSIFGLADYRSFFCRVVTRDGKYYIPKCLIGIDDVGVGICPILTDQYKHLENEGEGLQGGIMDD